jgi:excisionase family DNA binding protein
MSNNKKITRFYTKQEVAEMLQVSLRTVSYYMGCGLPYTKIRRSVRIPEDKLMEWLKEEKDRL